jgi:hypothetical protein
MNRLFGVLRIPPRPIFIKDRYNKRAAVQLKEFWRHDEPMITVQSLKDMYDSGLNDGGKMAFFLHNEYDWSPLDFDEVTRLHAHRNLPHHLYMADLLQWKLINEVKDLLDPEKPIFYWDKIVVIDNVDYRRYQYTLRYESEKDGLEPFTVGWEDRNVIQT